MMFAPGRATGATGPLSASLVNTQLSQQQIARKRARTHYLTTPPPTGKQQEMTGSCTNAPHGGGCELVTSLWKEEQRVMIQGPAVHAPFLLHRLSLASRGIAAPHRPRHGNTNQTVGTGNQRLVSTPSSISLIARSKLRPAGGGQDSVEGGAADLQALATWAECRQHNDK